MKSLLLFLSSIVTYTMLSASAHANSQELIAKLEKSRAELTNLLNEHSVSSYYSNVNCDDYGILGFITRKQCIAEQTRVANVRARLTINEGVFFRTINFSSVLDPKEIEYTDEASMDKLLSDLESVNPKTASTEEVIDDLDRTLKYRFEKQKVNKEKMAAIDAAIFNAKRILMDAREALFHGNVDDRDFEKLNVLKDWFSLLNIKIIRTSYFSKNARIEGRSATRYSIFYSDAKDAVMVLDQEFSKYNGEKGKFTQEIDSFTSSGYVFLKALTTTEQIKF